MLINLSNEAIIGIAAITVSILIPVFIFYYRKYTTVAFFFMTIEETIIEKKDAEYPIGYRLTPDELMKMNNIYGKHFLWQVTLKINIVNQKGNYAYQPSFDFLGLDSFEMIYSNLTLSDIFEPNKKHEAIFIFNAKKIDFAKPNVQDINVSLGFSNFGLVFNYLDTNKVFRTITLEVSGNHFVPSQKREFEQLVLRDYSKIN
ncbi:hypothetical protein [Pedobacter sp. CFBP9032]|uniref:hypothetical protein n=1 Tax=Pedobacter sp. CFBP9032 TaxID=3096539 RepID=UPI002A6ADA7D|nr:hypothetical protein [Pedobacter sp. CFBP9032]MDY0905619.1 hypothetical protein [Pedobacter sp. CFBP9032]